MTRSARGISSFGTVRTFLSKGTCSETLLHVLNRAHGHPNREEEHASGPLAGGIMQHGYQCGQIWGAALAAGAEAHQRFGAGARAQTMAIHAARRVVDAFRAQNDQTDCFDITELNETSSTARMVTYFLLKGGTVGCMRMAARYAPVALRAIDAALSDQAVDIPPAPVSCASVLLEKMGASERDAVMAAGLAGGIGLGGGACGALGAAIWFESKSSLERGATKVPYKSASSAALLDRFVKCTHYEFCCSAIVGRTFENVGDHARHLRERGCARILDALASR